MTVLWRVLALVLVMGVALNTMIFWPEITAFPRRCWNALRAVRMLAWGYWRQMRKGG